MRIERVQPLKKDFETIFTSRNIKAYKIDRLNNHMIKERWISILLIACSIVLFIGGISLVLEYYRSDITVWRLIHGILMIAFAVGLVKLGIQRPKD